MMLSEYHQEYAAYSDEEIQQRADEKAVELELIMEHDIFLETESEMIRLAVMGSGDKRFAKHHKEMFERIFGRPAEVTTLDITTEHLEGGGIVIQHDCAKPLPNGPYDITYAHVLLKFVDRDKQWLVIKNSYDALKKGGLAIHVLDKDDYESGAVPLEEYKDQMFESQIAFAQIPTKYGVILILTR